MLALARRPRSPSLIPAFALAALTLSDGMVRAAQQGLPGLPNRLRVQPDLEVVPNHFPAGEAEAFLVSIHEMNGSYGTSRPGSRQVEAGDSFLITIGCLDEVLSIDGVETTLAGSFDFVSPNATPPYAGNSVAIIYQGASDFFDPDDIVSLRMTARTARLPGPPCTDPLHDAPAACTATLDVSSRNDSYYPRLVVKRLLTGCADDLGIIGPQGPAGATGDTGATGPRGPAGPNVIAPGSPTAPGLSFTGDSDTGIFSAGADTFDITTGGVKRTEVRPDGDLDLTAANSALRIDGNRFLHQRGGPGNTATGRNALTSVTSGADNTASGLGALAMNTTGRRNTATGSGALQANTTAINNTATGFLALSSTTIGSENTANGFAALRDNTIGFQNTASGQSALAQNTVGAFNTANGVQALQANTNGLYNTASGYGALESNSSGYANTATGSQSLRLNRFGGYNTASGVSALHYNTGSLNTAIGSRAGLALTTGSNNICMGAEVLGVAGESNTIRIGNGTTRAFIDGIFGKVISGGTTVYVNSAGQLGTVLSSRRYKWDIEDMGDASSRILRLRPVTFRYNQQQADGSQPIEFGLIAEEVAEVYPDLVVHGANGQVETVQYWKLDAMLLNELQKQHAEIEAQREELAILRTRLEAIESYLGSKEAVAAGRGRR